ncbi:YijD family membrane protein [Vibrio hippocampi]|uniref:Inner membrane protein YijD n=1 Tax=Vibrio hippocampi TaxID=654686 RepID=A0ABN8DCP3_9VIBR|nr:YijD family membrane protein [Vibrio hippocampi]CAH0524353.1 Inner membrane protein YijD [Vibrio hippocampi]
MSIETSSDERRNGQKTLVLAVIAGMCGNAMLSWFTISEVAFSIFPLIALVLSVQALYQEYLNNPVTEDVPLVGLAAFFVGAFGHSAFTKAQYPDAGSNFFSIIVVLLLLFWIGKKLGYILKQE